MSNAVLVIEDEALLGKNFRLYLERQGHDVRLARSAEAGLEMIEEFRPEAIVLDFNLPGMDGLEALARIRRQDPDAVLVMMSARCCCGRSKASAGMSPGRRARWACRATRCAIGSRSFSCARRMATQRSGHDCQVC